MVSIEGEPEGKERFTVPIGLGDFGLLKIGAMPVRWGIEAQYYILKPGPDADDALRNDSYIPSPPNWNKTFCIGPFTMNPFK
ncbi:hypothetical protein ACVFI8_19090 [Agarivorans sp. MS3-6]|uniref:hypothetical protein n=1 Tax=Agarivorans sp. TSD2052 TaxID=2937286 RepID=UPI00200F3CE9|nr:hypothetical protein [Agarivorans sp. TSD2052]UPW17056.1 hypothetical protein M0C34_12440 [Agarivorans sp. TSD2052]